MLLKAETILTEKDRYLDISEKEVYDRVKKNMIDLLYEQMMCNGLIKIQTIYSEDPAYGEYSKIIASVRVYNPDD